MGLYGTMRTSVSGMAAQANRLGAVSDNIANSSTTGYKRASMEFSSLVLDSGGTEYVSGGVESHMRYAISEQGAFKFTTSVTDLAVKGDGFFVVSGNTGQTFLTRAGSFVPDGDRRPRQRRRLQADGLQPGVRRPERGRERHGRARGRQPRHAGAAGQSLDGSELFVNLPSNAAVTVAADLPSVDAALTRAGHQCELHTIETATELTVTDYDLVIVGASIHAGHHQKHLVEWTEHHRTLLGLVPSAFFSVCLSAAEDTEESRAITRDYLDDFEEHTGWTPRRRTTFAGALQYREYDFMTRLAVRLMMHHGGHPTDTSRDYDYTDWDAVDAFALECAEMAAATARA